MARYDSSSSPTRSRVCAGVVFSKREARSLDVLLLNFSTLSIGAAYYYRECHHYSHKETRIHLDVGFSDAYYIYSKKLDQVIKWYKE